MNPFVGCRLPVAVSGALILLTGACAQPAQKPQGAVTKAESVVIITIDTLRADHVGAYGFAGGRTPTLDALARDGVRFDKAWAPAPITLTSHASLFTGRYPPGHGARHNGMAMNNTVPTLAATLEGAGFQTAAFVSAFPLDRRFGLERGFDVYDDELPRASNGRPQNERPGADTVSRAIAWLQRQPPNARLFLWVHLFEPHAPYGDPRQASSQPAQARYDEDIAVADREAGRLLGALGARIGNTLVAATSDHGEAFGEHGEIGHSIFVYDTTLRVPLIFKGPGVPKGAVAADDVALVDVAPTVLSILEAPSMDVDGRSLVPAFGGARLEPRAIYAESFAPLLDFGWASLRAVRDGQWKYVAAPKPELYDLARDAGETSNRIGEDPQRASRLETQASRWSPPELTAPPASASRETTARLRSLGYAGGGSPAKGGGSRPDPKDRIALASRIAAVTSGEVQGSALIPALEAILEEDPQNPQAHLRLGYAELERNRCARAEPHFRTALAAAIPSADAGLGLANCRGQAGDLQGAGRALEAAQAAEPGNPLVLANLGLLAARQNQLPGAIDQFRRALSIDPGLLEIRFELARALGRAGDREGAAKEAQLLLTQLPPDAPQRPEVERLLAAVR
jgi:arylsulfatase A-like enzyme/thioredoxin-like negative regulator of GroEL